MALANKNVLFQATFEVGDRILTLEFRPGQSAQAVSRQACESHHLPLSLAPTLAVQIQQVSHRLSKQAGLNKRDEQALLLSQEKQSKMLSVRPSLLSTKSNWQHLHRQKEEREMKECTFRSQLSFLTPLASRGSSGRFDQRLHRHTASSSRKRIQRPLTVRTTVRPRATPQRHQAGGRVDQERASLVQSLINNQLYYRSFILKKSEPLFRTLMDHQSEEDCGKRHPEQQLLFTQRINLRRLEGVAKTLAGKLVSKYPETSLAQGQFLQAVKRIYEQDLNLHERQAMQYRPCSHVQRTGSGVGSKQ